MIEFVSERFQIDIRSVHMAIEFRACILGDVAGGHSNCLDSTLAARIGNIDRVFGKDHRIIVSKGNRSTSELFSRKRDLFRRRSICELVPLARFGDIPVLTKPATEIAARCTKRQYTRSRQEMVERFLFNRIDAKSAAPAISGQHHPIAHSLPNETKPALALVQFTKPRT